MEQQDAINSNTIINRNQIYCSIKGISKSYMDPEILEETCHQQAHPTTIFCDNQSSIKLTKNPVYHVRSKHIEVHHHFVRDLMESEVIKLHFTGTEDQVANIFTKSLSTVKFLKISTLLFLKEVDV